MIPAIIEFARDTTKNRYIGHVLELGSKIINGTVRDALEERAESYLGLDIEEGLGVDEVIEDISTYKSSRLFDTVVCCETLEHTINPWKIVHCLRQMIRPKGLFLVSTPTFGFPEHRYPIDCYRFGVDAYREFIFKDLEILALETVYDHAGFPVICGLAMSTPKTS